MSLSERGDVALERSDARYRVGGVPAGGDGCYAAVTCAERTQPAEGAQPLATARHNLGRADTTLKLLKLF